MRFLLPCFILVIWFIPIWIKAQQIPDLAFDPAIETPKYWGDKTIIIGIDSSHQNFHQIDGGFAPFAKLLEADGYFVQAVNASDPKELEKLNILVIANPIHPSNQGNWKRPIQSAFEPAEIEQIQQWVLDGGSLLLIADHMPFAGATKMLAEAFDYTFVDGFCLAKKQQWPPEIYSKSNGTLYENELTQGVQKLVGFTGSALQVPEEATVIAHFPETHEILIPEVAWEFKDSTIRKPIQDYVFGAYQTLGKGKLAVFSEAALFTAQIVQNQLKVGFTAPEATDNQRFARNVIHWLDNGKTRSKAIANGALPIVKSLLEQQAEAFRNNQLQQVADFYHSEAIIYEPTGQEIIGKPAIQAYWATLQGKAVDWQVNILETERIGDQILVIAKLNITFTDQDQTLHARSKALITFVQEGDTLKIHRDFYFPLKH
ncbi:MAG: nuclear transport factor 2 family protein [Bacteroidota bacterium]